jgi:CheY-like chemotaxis protein
MLINDILDLSKIESGTVMVDVGEVCTCAICAITSIAPSATWPKPRSSISRRFDAAAAAMFTDAKRLQQIIKNLLSNAFKFTDTGQVTLDDRAGHRRAGRRRTRCSTAPRGVAFSVRDTGIGIPPDKQQIIFEAFQQADGSTSRKYGGTGLGLAISREIAGLLGGEITYFARVLLDAAREQGYKVAIATRGSAALQLAHKVLAGTTITLDINLPDIDGWRVLNRLKDDPATRHIPVQIITTEEERVRGLRMGAMGVLTKPVKTKESLDELFGRLKDITESSTPQGHRVENDAEQRELIRGLVGGEDMDLQTPATPEEAMQLLQGERRPP